MHEKPIGEVALEWRPLNKHYHTPWRPLGKLAMALAVLLACVAVALAIAYQFHGASLPPLPELSHLLLFVSDTFDRITSASLRDYVTRLAPLGLLAVQWSILSLPQRQRLIFGTSTLSLDRGLPRWLAIGPISSLRGWSMPYAAITSVRLEAIGPQVGVLSPEQSVSLLIDRTEGESPRRLDLSHWFHPGDPPRKRKQSTTSGFEQIRNGQWSSEEDQKILQQIFDKLPLVHELRSRGVALPDFEQRALASSQEDIWGDIRLRQLVIGFFVSGLVFLLSPMLLQEYWVVAPPFWIWPSIGVASVIFAFLWARHPTPAGKRQASLPARRAAVPKTGTRVVLALLFGLSAGAAAYPGLMWLNCLAGRTEDVRYYLDERRMLVPAGTSMNADLPAFSPQQSIAFWASRQPGSEFTLQMRKGLFGRWQYGVELIRAEIEAF